MAKLPSPSPGPDLSPEGRPGRAPACRMTGEEEPLPMVDDAALDALLRQALDRLYGEVLAEPVPERLLRIIRGGQPR